MEKKDDTIRKSKKKGCGGCLAASCILLAPLIIFLMIVVGRSELHEHWRWEMYRGELKSPLVAIDYDESINKSPRRLECTNPKILQFISSALNHLNGDWPDHSIFRYVNVDVILTFKNGASFSETLGFREAAGAWYMSLSNPQTMRADARRFFGRLRGDPPPGFMRMMTFLSNWKLRGNLDLK